MTPKIPGVEPETVKANGVTQVEAEEAKVLCMEASSGIWFPYHRIDGAKVIDSGKPFGRLKLDQPKPNKKYHQQSGTVVHAFVPKSLSDAPESGDLHVVEGEKKALALCDAGFPAVGIGGFFCFANRGESPEGEVTFDLAEELVEVLKQKRPKRLLFVGDNDTAINFQFSQAAVRLAGLVEVPVLLPRIPVDYEGKGADDCRALNPAGFKEWWEGRILQAVPVDKGMDPAHLAWRLFEAESERFAKTKDSLHVQERLTWFAAALSGSTLIQEKVIGACVSMLGFRRDVFSRAVKKAAKRSKPREGESFEMFYSKGRFWIRDNREMFIDLDSASAIRHAAEAGYSKDRREENGISEAEQFITTTQKEHTVDYAGPLAGWDAGFHWIQGNRVLVTRSPRLVVGEAGPCDTIESLIQQLFHDPENPHLDQRSHFLGWLKLAVESLASRQGRQAQAIVLCGPPGAGKSLLQLIITEVLGGRSAKPYRYLSNQTTFNSELFAAEHLMIEDEVPSTDIRARRALGSNLKAFTVNSTHSCHGKHQTAILLKPFWRVTISVNSEPENLMIIPPIDESLADKLMLFKCSIADLGDNGTLEAKERLWKRITAEVPAFVHLLNRHAIQPEHACPRYGVRHFHHPRILQELASMAPEETLLELIDELFQAEVIRGPWQGTARQLEQRLRDCGRTANSAGKVLCWGNACGTYLGRLEKRREDRIRQDRKSNARLWVITPPVATSDQ